MREQNPLTPAQQELELALRSLAPPAARIDPISAAFAAGRRSGQTPVRAWQATAGLLLLVAAGPWLMPPKSAPPASPGPFSIPLAIHAASAPTGPGSDQTVLFLQQALRGRSVEDLPATAVPSGTIRQAKDPFQNS